MSVPVETVPAPSDVPAPDPSGPARDGQLAESLPGRYYLDPDQLVQDREHVFGRSWLAVLRSDELAPGSFARVDLAGQDTILVRDRAGVVRAFANLCRHRGATLCTEDSGELRRALRCVYHAWTYALDGSLLATPNAHEMPDLDRSRFGLVAFPTTEWLGYVWASADLDVAPLGDQVRPQLESRLGDASVLDRYGIERLRLGHRQVYEVASNWKCIVENFMECYHCATIHPELTAALPQFASGWGTVSGGVGAGATFAEALEGFALSGGRQRDRLPGLTDADDRLFHGVILRPNVFLILVPDHVAFFRMEPVAHDHTRVTVDWLFDAAEVERDDFDPGDSVGLLDVTNRQDFDACQRAQRGMSSPHYRGVLVPSEHIVLDFHDYYRRALGEGPPATAPPGSR